MGCCVSSLDENNKANSSKQQHSMRNNVQFRCVSKSPPRAEEETVKEILSETPKPKPRPEFRPEVDPLGKAVPTQCELVVTPMKQAMVQKVATLDQKVPFFEQKMIVEESRTPDEAISEVSEMCSLSETISATTLEEQQQWSKGCASSGEVSQMKEFRSQGHNGNLKYRQNAGLSRSHGRSPVRQADNTSPARKRHLGPGWSPGQVVPRSDVAGEKSIRRSRSPAMRSNVGRSQAARKTAPSPGRTRMVRGPEGERRLEEDHIHVNGKRNEDIHGNGNKNDEGQVDGNRNEKWDGPNESLENPLVSLECFIFL